VLWANRGNAFAELSEWDKASSDYVKATEDKAADQVAWYRHALLRLHLGDRQGYALACTMILDRFNKQENPATADLAVWVCVLASDSVADYPRLVQWAEKLLATDPKNSTYLNTLGAALYRAGRFDEALKRLSEANAIYKPADEQRSALAYNCCFLAMVHHRLGHAEEARKWQDKARQGTDRESAANGLAWNRRLTLPLLRRETEESMTGTRTNRKGGEDP
jgi:tetratricopeptide (TPR) repeat protein